MSARADGPDPARRGARTAARSCRARRSPRRGLRASPRRPSSRVRRSCSRGRTRSSPRPASRCASSRPRSRSSRRRAPATCSREQWARSALAGWRRPSRWLWLPWLTARPPAWPLPRRAGSSPPTSCGRSAPARVTRSTLEIDLAAIHANARRLIEVAGHSRLWAVVKADGYGHGAVECAARRSRPVPSASAARRWRRRASYARSSVRRTPIVVLSPLQPGEEAQAAGFEIVVSSLQHYDRLRAAGVSSDVHVKADTGMGRWGMAPADALGVGRELAAGAARLRLAGVMSHLATADATRPSRACRPPSSPRWRASFRLSASPRQLGRRADLARDAFSTPCAAASRSTACRRSSAIRRAWAAVGSALDESRGRIARPAPGASSPVRSPLIARQAQRARTCPVGYADGYP